MVLTENSNGTYIIVDSGASVHVVCDLGYLKDAKVVPSVNVDQSNGTKVSSAKEGIIKVRTGNNTLFSCHDF